MSIHDYIGHPLVAWNDYNRNPVYLDKNTRCYISPRLSDKSGIYDIADVDRIEVELGQNVEPFFNRVGALVEIRMLVPPVKNNNPNMTNPYFMWYGKAASGKGGILIEQYTGEHLLQVIRSSQSFDSIVQTHTIPSPSFGCLTKRVLIEANGAYYGPFEQNRIDDRLFRLSARKEDRFYVGKYSDDTVRPHLMAMTEGGMEIIDSRRLPELTESNRVDFFTNAELRDMFVASLDLKSREQIEKLKTFFTTLHPDFFSPEREQRITRILRNAEYQDRMLREIAYYILKTQDLCENVMEKIVKERLDMVLQRIPDAPRLPLHHAAAEPDHTEPESAGLFHPPVQEEQNPELESKIAERKAALLKMETRYEKLLERVGLVDDVEQQRAESKQIRKEVEVLQKAAAAAQEKLDTIRKDATLEAKTVAKAIDKSFLDLVLKSIGDKEIAETYLPPFNVAILSKEIRPQRIIDRVLNVLDSAGRILPGDDKRSRNEIANYLICLTQGFMTTFAGDPGTGKTSLCQLLAGALGLIRDDEHRRFVEVSVERGWTSHKDFIGYYNPLSKSMEISNKEVFNALTLLEREVSSKPEETAPFVILLDEANLSPIEHYWAAFLRNCDFDSVSDRTINMGGQSLLRIPNHLRFLATVNFDHTTEELSPRFIDRSWIITLHPEEININQSAVRNYETEKVISFEALSKSFLPQSQKIDTAILEEWNAIQSIFSNHKLPIYPRNLKMVYQYFQVAFSCMDTSSEENRFAPLDYAVAQKILPTINGNGEQYGLLIDELLKQSSGKLPLCHQHLTRISTVAESNLGFYQFFIR